MEGARWPFLIVGGLLVPSGSVWAAQGLGLLGGSVMTGRREWVVIGLAAVVVGLWLVRAGLPRDR